MKLPKVTFEELEAAILTPVPEVKQPKPPINKQTNNHNDNDSDDESRSSIRSDNKKTSSFDSDDESRISDIRTPSKTKRRRYEDDETDFKPDIDYKVAPAVDPEPEPHLLVTIIVSLLKGYFGHGIGSKINEKTWQASLRRIFNLILVGKEGKTSPFVQECLDENGRPTRKDLSFNDLDLRTKAQVVYNLCEFRLYADDSSNIITQIEEDELRVNEPLGQDSQGNDYWYFFGSRLYRENKVAAERVAKRIRDLERQKHYFTKEEQRKQQNTSNDKKVKKNDVIPGERSSSRTVKTVERLTVDWEGKRKPTPSSVKKKHEEDMLDHLNRDENTSCGVALELLQEAWSCVCSTEQEWIDLCNSFKSSKHHLEKDLYKNLSENFLPMMKDIIKQEELIKRKNMYHKELVYQSSLPLDMLPRRASSRIEVKQKQKEEEDRKLAIQREQERREEARLEYERKQLEKAKSREERLRERQEKEEMMLQLEKQRLERLERRRQRILEMKEKQEIKRIKNLLESGDDDRSSQDDDYDISDSDVSVVTVNGWPFNE